MENYKIENIIKFEGLLFLFDHTYLDSQYPPISIIIEIDEISVEYQITYPEIWRKTGGLAGDFQIKASAIFSTDLELFRPSPNFEILNILLIKEILDKKAEILNNYLLHIKDRFKRHLWVIPYFLPVGLNKLNLEYHNTPSLTISLNSHISQNGIVIKNPQSIPVSWQEPGKISTSEHLKTIKDKFEKGNQEFSRPKKLIHWAIRDLLEYNLGSSVLNAAIAVESLCLEFVDMNGRILHKNFAKRCSKDQLRLIIDDITNQEGFLNTLGVDMKLFKRLFEVRNKVAHYGEAFFRENGSKVLISKAEANELLNFANDFVEDKFPKLCSMYKKK